MSKKETPPTLVITLKCAGKSVQAEGIVPSAPFVHNDPYLMETCLEGVVNEHIGPLVTKLTGEMESVCRLIQKLHKAQEKQRKARKKKDSK